jgi:hypothetical protein
LYPPLWKDVDAVVQLILPAGAGNILHFPPVYCFLSRILFLISSWLPWGGGGSLASLLAEQHPSLLGIYLLVIFQHLLLVASLAFVVVSLTDDLVLRGLFTLFLATSSSFYAYAHSCGSEGLSSATIFAIFACGISIIRNKGFVYWVLYGGALFLAIGCRHINVLFIFWLPCTLGVLALMKRFGWYNAPCEINAFKLIGMTLLIGLLAGAANSCIARVMIAAARDEYRGTLGRTLSERIDHFLVRLKEQERIRLAKVIASKVNDPNVQGAIISLATTGSFYDGTDQKIAEGLIRSGVPQERISAESDRVILKAALCYLESLHPMLMRVILQDFSAGFTDASNQRIALAAFDANKSAAGDKVARPSTWKSIAQWPALDLPYASYLSDHVRLDPYITLQGSVSLGFFAIVTTCLSVIACVRKGRVTEAATVALSILLFGTLVYGVNTVCIFYLHRYALPLFAAVIVALFASLTALGEMVSAK